jgi:TatD DNase family protein
MVFSFFVHLPTNFSAKKKMKFLNFHTHQADQRPDVAAIVCYEPLAFQQESPSACPMASVGLHPWHADVCSGAQLNTLAQLLQLPQIVAVGEVGLDRLCQTDYQHQLKIFDIQLRLAAVVQKPVIVHCVKAIDDLLAELDVIDNRPPIIVHGFRGKPQQAEQLLRHGCRLSIGGKYNTETVQKLPSGAFMIETDDDAEADIKQTYSQIAEIRDCTLQQLMMQQQTNWASIGILPDNQ